MCHYVHCVYKVQTSFVHVYGESWCRCIDCGRLNATDNNSVTVSVYICSHLECGELHTAVCAVHHYDM